MKAQPPKTKKNRLAKQTSKPVLELLEKTACPLPTPLPKGKKKIALALQGGGAHGAFTWGVLDAILADDKLEIEAISGTSAGSMNAAMVVFGMQQGGRERARQMLKEFWQRIARYSALGPLQTAPWEKWFGGSQDTSLAFIGFDFMTRFFSPKQLNPLGLNPLRDILLDMIDFSQICTGNQIELYVSATNVRSGALKVFHNDDVTVDALLASACLPFLFKAVEIKGESYWDGGYMGNPTLYPLIHRCGATDAVIVQINPLTRETVPDTSSGIIDRVNEISFNSSLIHELRGLAIINRLIHNNHLANDAVGLRHLHLHMVQDEQLMSNLSYASKLNTDYASLCTMRDAGSAAATRWIAEHFDKIGVQSSLDVGLLAFEAA